MVEVWKPVVGHEGAYEVSDQGRVRSLDRDIRLAPSHQAPSGCTIHIRGRTLRPGLSSNGYLTVAIERESVMVQHLVAAAFIGPRPEGLLVLHGDGCRTNNAATNLRYGTYAENAADAAEHGTRTRGSSYRSAKLDEWTAGVVRALKGMWSQADLAMLFQVSPAAVQAVHDGRTWTHANQVSRETALDWFYSFGPAGSHTPVNDNAQRELDRRAGR